jgi:hypothetical protein
MKAYMHPFGYLERNFQNIWYLKMFRTNLVDKINVLIYVGGLCVVYKTGLNWMIRFIDTFYTHKLGTTGNTAILLIYTLYCSQFTVTPALGFSVFTSRILTTDLSQSHCHFTSHMKSSFHSLIPSATANFEDSTHFNSSAPKLISLQAGALWRKIYTLEQ